MRFDLDHLRVFLVVAKAGSFTAASEILHLSQPSVSRTMQILEERIGTPLFIRLARGLALTSAGKKLLEFAERVIGEADSLSRAIHDEHNEPKGELVIGMTPATSVFLMQFMPEFLSLYPQMELKILGHLDKMDLRYVDVALRSFLPEQPDLAQRFLLKYSIKLYASAQYLKEFGVPKTAEDLAHHRLIKYSDDRMRQYASTASIDWITQIGMKKGESRKLYIEASPAEALVYAAQLGLGITELADVYMETRSHDLIEVLPKLPTPHGELYYIYHKNLEGSKRVTALAEFLEQKLAKR